MLVIASGMILIVNGCATRPVHLLNPKAVYVVPPEGIEIKSGGLLFDTNMDPNIRDLKRINGPTTIPAGWRLTGPKETQ
jgi:hypothetical protein